MGIFFVLFFLLIRNCWVKASSWEPPGASVGELVVGVFLPRPQLSGGATRAAAERGSDWGIRSCLVGALPFLLHNALKGGVGGSPAHQRASLKDSMRHTLQGAVTAGSQPMCGGGQGPAMTVEDLVPRPFRRVCPPCHRPSGWSPPQLEKFSDRRTNDNHWRN